MTLRLGTSFLQHVNHPPHSSALRFGSLFLVVTLFTLLLGRTPAHAFQDAVPVNEKIESQTPTEVDSVGQPITQESPESETDQSEVVKLPTVPQEPRKEFESPRNTMFTFLEAMGKWAAKDGDPQTHLDRAVECFDLLNSAEGDAEQAPRILAQELFGIINRLGEVKKGYLPSARTANGTTTRSQLSSYTYYPLLKTAIYTRDGSVPGFIERSDGHLYLPSFTEIAPDGFIELSRTINNEWRFSADTVAQIHDFYSAVSELPIRFGTDERALSLQLRIRSLFPRTLRDGHFANIEYWQWIGLLTLIFIGILLDFTFRMIFRTIVKTGIKARGASASNDAIRGLVRPLGLLVAGIFWLQTIKLLGLPPAALNVLSVAIHFITMVAGVWAAFRLADVLSEALASRAALTDTKFDDLLVPLVRKTAKVFIAAFGLIYIADSLDIEILPLLTGLGIGGAAIAFASKDTVENFFGSIAVIVDRPFEVGDWIVTSNVEGTVESLGFRSTRVRTFYNSLITIPNSNLVRAVVDNYGQRKYRRYKTMISLTYDTAPEKIEAFCEGIRELIRLHPYTRKDYFHVWLNQFEGSSLDVLLYMFFETPEWSTELRERHRFMLDVIRLADELGVEFAFPTQTLHLHQEATASDQPDIPFDGSKIQPVNVHADAKAQRQGLEAASRLTSEAAWRSGIKPAPVQFGAVALPDLDPENEDSQVENRSAGG